MWAMALAGHAPAFCAGRTRIVVGLRTRLAFRARARATFLIRPDAVRLTRAVRWNVFSRDSRRTV
jgi:hypothetical protein